MSASLSAKGFYASTLSLWVIISFVAAQALSLFILVATAAIYPEIRSVNPAVFATISAALSYTLAVVIAVGLPAMIRRRPIQKDILGVARAIKWSDIGLALASLVPYYIVSSIIIAGMAMLFSGIDPSQEQSIPFSDLSQRYEYIVAFITLVVMAPLAEELLFRGYFLGKMRTRLSAVASVVITALVFGAMHLIGEYTDKGITLQWAAALDTFALGLLLGSLRLMTGSIWPSVLLHVFKNFIAYFFLFIYPLLTGTM